MTSPYPTVLEYFLIGRTLKSHGTSGQLRIMIEDRLRDYLQSGHFIFLDLDGSKVPFQINSVKEGQHLVLTLKDIDGKLESDTLCNKDILIPIHQVKPKHLKSPASLKAKWEDYTIIDAQSNTTYGIIRTEEFPQQLMAVVLVNEKEIYIPLLADWIENINRANKTVEMKIPEGLFEL